MKNHFHPIPFFFAGLAFFAASQVYSAVSSNIIVDQFGYKPSDPKIVVFAQPNVGLGSPSAFNLGAGATFQVINASGGATVFTGNAVTWGGGAVHSQSGDKAWQGTFTALSAPGTYYIQVPGGSNPGSTSYNFQIRTDIFNGVLTASQRSYFYQRCGGAISAGNGGAWNHTVCHENASQDLAAHLWDGGDLGQARDVHAGWHDAGDYAKYVTFVPGTLWYLMHSPEWYPLGYTDSSNIPESGNGVPDIFDEVKWELDWLLRMQRSSDGALYSVVGQTNGSGNTGNPALDINPRYYTNVSTSATAAGAMAFALGARLFQAYPAYASYAVTLQNAAVSAWGYLQANAAPVNYNPASIVNANANVSAAGDLQLRVGAAAELFALTGSAAYRTYFDSNYNSAAVGGPISNPPAAGDAYDPSGSEPLQLGMVSYCLAPGATAAVTSAIGNAIKNECDHILDWYGNSDPYQAYIYDGHYCWGSNQLKASWGSQLLFAIKLNVNPARNTAYFQQAEEYLHYFHGRNPLNWVYLTNMGTGGANLGASKTVRSIFHSWFFAGTTYDGNTGAGALGPAPGILVGGPNQFYAPDASYIGPVISPPQNQPPMKSYKDWGNSWPENSWEVTENSQGYQGKYQFLLSAFAVSNAPTPTPTVTPTGTLATATFTATLTPTLTITQTPTPTATTCVILFNGAETLAENGNWTGSRASRSVSGTNHTQGSTALQIAVTQAAASPGWNDDIFNLDSFAPAVWTNVAQLKMDVNLSASMTGSTYSQLLLYASSNAAATYYQSIALPVALLSGQNNDVTFTINFALGGIPSGAALSNLILIYNGDSPTGLGNLSVDNIRLITNCPATNTPTRTATASPTRTPTPTPSPTATQSPTKTATASPSQTASSTATATASNTASRTPTNSPTLTATDSATGTSTATGTMTFTPTASSTPTLTPTGTISPSNTPTLSFTFTSTASRTPTASATSTPTLTATDSMTPTVTNSVTVTPSLTATASPTPTRTSSATATASPTSSPTSAPSNTASPTGTSTPTGIPTFTLTPTLTFTRTATPSPTRTPTLTATPSASPTFSSTSTVPPTLTWTVTPNPSFPTPHFPVFYPNPADGSTPVRVRLNLTAPSDVKVHIYTTAFRKVAEQSISQVPVGKDLDLDLKDNWGTPLASGIYYVVITAGGDRSVGKMLILR